MAKVTFEIMTENSDWFEETVKEFSQKTFKSMIEIIYSYDEIERIFNNYTTKHLDLDLHAYDEFVPIADDNRITIDLTEIEEDCPSEYNLIVDSLIEHYGKNIFIDDGSCEDRILNAELILKRAFPKAYVRVVKDGISVIGDMSELNFG